MYVDAAYFYRPNSMVCLLVDQSVTLVSLAITAEPIEMPFSCELRWGSRSPIGKGIFKREKGWPIVKYSDFLLSYLHLDQKSGQDAKFAILTLLSIQKCRVSA